MVTGEGVHGVDERFRDRRQDDRGGHRQPHLVVDVLHEAGGVLQPRHVHVQVHPVDRLDLEHHVLGQDVGDGAR
jgi:hypothetical protein